MDPVEQFFPTLIAALCGVSTTKAVNAEAAAGFLALFRNAAAQEKNFGAGTADALVNLFVKVLNTEGDPVTAAKLILAGTFDSDPPPDFPAIAYSTLTRALAFFVLTGGWQIDCDPENAVIPSPAAYSNGLVWLIAQAHPQGVSGEEFGSWATPPDPLSRFIGV